MSAIPVIAIFDVGKTNKKIFLFNDDYEIVFEQSSCFNEVVDEDGFPCDDIALLTSWVLNTLENIINNTEYKVKAINVTTYGASFVYVDAKGKPITPLYNYLKPYPKDLKQLFYDQYGGEEVFSLQTASPVLDSLNSGMQLYRLKYEKPNQFEQTEYALHLPQYLSYLIHHQPCSDITSIGCHTNLWNFNLNNYHEWVDKEDLTEKLPPIKSCNVVFNCTLHPGIVAGIGLHDSSAALIPYHVKYDQPIVLLSTGTWCISLNPFNERELTVDELRHDCLAYLQYNGKPVKASRLFAGHEHEEQVKRIASHFKQPLERYRDMTFDRKVFERLLLKDISMQYASSIQLVNESVFATRDLSIFDNDIEAYYQLMRDIILRQQVSTQLVLTRAQVKHLYVDGGFSKNSIYMHLLAGAFPQLQVFAASVAQATALGAALAIHDSWNPKPIPNDLVAKTRVQMPGEDG